ncbi:prepilin peptidase [Phaeovulum vinaykumarii]|uniref:Prepilin peptidase CpaA n=1 Tax=Phaeovulum vinaykumarii TaxID=407234 RepID=A0A1N7L1Y9_9RHOB|nr:prepilin peptidase [Phaeovulum vinaykumarii]SIS67868.1 prepilin peptidase CpaA [Phaeovulum vinaykumarii]SOC00505.1 prepilin peptidase CpaA [Phaeovulum vinaykumarii]
MTGDPMHTGLLGLDPAQAAGVLAIVAAPICLWVALSDLRHMKIPNQAVLALIAVYAVVGPFVLPLDVWAWRWLHLAVVLAVGFVLNMIAHFGAGDAKFAAAMAPFFALSHAGLALVLLALCLLTSFLTHRLVRAVPPLRGLAPDWESWRRKDFPLGIALVATLMSYLLLLATLG